MTDLQIWDPIQDFAKIFDDGFFPRRSQIFRRNFMPIEIEELDGKIFVRAKVSGIKKDEIDLVVNQDSVTISVKKSMEKKEGKKGTIHYSEFFKEEEIVRTIQLPTSIDTTKVEAELKDGILEIFAPTLASAKERKVEIK